MWMQCIAIYRTTTTLLIHSSVLKDIQILLWKLTSNWSALLTWLEDFFFVTCSYTDSKIRTCLDGCNLNFLIIYIMIYPYKKLQILFSILWNVCKFISSWNCFNVTFLIYYFSKKFVLYMRYQYPAIHIEKKFFFFQT